MAKKRSSALKLLLRESLPERLFELAVILQSRFDLLFTANKISGYIIGPTNSANQASAWAKALSVGKSTDFALSLRISADPSKEWFTADHELRTNDRKDELARKLLLSRVFMPKSMILMESMRPIFAFRKGGQGFAPQHCIDDIALLKRMGKRVGVIFHGSDIRDPMAHALSNPHSPFAVRDRNPAGRPEAQELRPEAQELRPEAQELRPEAQELRPEAQELRPEAQELLASAAVNRALVPLLRTMRVPIFITTPDLFLEVPDATWLPVVIDLPRFNRVAEVSPLFVGEKLRVLYLPSRSWIKSSELVLPILEKLDQEGLIEWKNWVESGAVTHDQIADILAETDLVIDQFIGLIGVFALEAIAAGRIVLTYIDEAHAHHPTPPHINVTPETLESELRRVIVDRDHTLMRRQVLVAENGVPTLRFIESTLDEGIRAGRDFLYFYHEGSYSATIIKRTLLKGGSKFGGESLRNFLRTIGGSDA